MAHLYTTGLSIASGPERVSVLDLSCTYIIISWYWSVNVVSLKTLKSNPEPAIKDLHTFLTSCETNLEGTARGWGGEGIYTCCWSCLCLSVYLRKHKVSPSQPNNSLHAWGTILPASRFFLSNWRESIARGPGKSVCERAFAFHKRKIPKTFFKLIILGANKLLTNLR